MQQVPEDCPPSYHSGTSYPTRIRKLLICGPSRSCIAASNSAFRITSCWCTTASRTCTSNSFPPLCFEAGLLADLAPAPREHHPREHLFQGLDAFLFREGDEGGHGPLRICEMIVLPSTSGLRLDARRLLPLTPRERHDDVAVLPRCREEGHGIVLHQLQRDLRVGFQHPQHIEH
jgi:hypothetical protein